MQTVPPPVQAQGWVWGKIIEKFLRMRTDLVLRPDLIWVSDLRRILALLRSKMLPPRKGVEGKDKTPKKVNIRP